MSRRFHRTLPAIMAMTLLVVGVPLGAERGDDANRKSKNGRTEGEIDGVTLIIEYGRPNVGGRKIWGGLVPYDKVWRTGADEATTISFEGDVLVEGQPLASGTYALFTIPSEDEWTVIFNSKADQWGAFNYTSEDDVLSVNVEPEEAEFTETLTFDLDDDAVVLRWADLAIGFAVAAGE